MKKIKKFEQYSSVNKDSLIEKIKKHITKTVAFQSGFRDDNDNKFIKLHSYESGNETYDAYIVMLGKDDVLIQTYCDGDNLSPTEVPPYEEKYEDLDIDILEKILNSLFLGDHIDIN